MTKSSHNIAARILVRWCAARREAEYALSDLAVLALAAVVEAFEVESED